MADEERQHLERVAADEIQKDDGVFSPVLPLRERALQVVVEADHPQASHVRVEKPLVPGQEGADGIGAGVEQFVLAAVFGVEDSPAVVEPAGAEVDPLLKAGGERFFYVDPEGGRVLLDDEFAQPLLHPRPEDLQVVVAPQEDHPVAPADEPGQGAEEERVPLADRVQFDRTALGVWEEAVPPLECLVPLASARLAIPLPRRECGLLLGGDPARTRLSLPWSQRRKAHVRFRHLGPVACVETHRPIWNAGAIQGHWGWPVGGMQPQLDPPLQHVVLEDQPLDPLWNSFRGGCFAELALPVPRYRLGIGGVHLLLATLPLPEVLGDHRAVDGEEIEGVADAYQLPPPPLDAVLVGPTEPTEEGFVEEEILPGVVGAALKVISQREVQVADEEVIPFRMVTGHRGPPTSPL